MSDDANTLPTSTGSGRAKPAKRSPARKRLRLPPADRRRQIIDGAVAYFAEVGFDGGTRALAERLGITQPLLYRYFPSKEDLIRQVYDEVYVGRWRTEWESLITDRAVPLRDRLVAFYERYTEVIFAPEWIRIYLFSGLRGLGINRSWITFVEDHILAKICNEIRHANGLPGVDAVPIQDGELDVYWMFHGGIFYYGMRRDVYDAAPRLELRRFVDLCVDGLLQGFPAVARRVLEESRRA